MVGDGSLQRLWGETAPHLLCLCVMCCVNKRWVSQVTSDRVAYHVLGHPCEGCGGLNTAVTDGPFQPTPDSPPAEQGPAEDDSDSDPNMGVD